MAIQFNHTILYAHDSETSAAFLAEMLGLPDPVRWGPFRVVKTDNGTNLDYMDVNGEITRQHYAFLVEESDFDDLKSWQKTQVDYLLRRDILGLGIFFRQLIDG